MNCLIEKLKRRLTLKETVDKKVLAGALLKFGTLVLNGTLQAKMQEKAEQLKYKREED